MTERCAADVERGGVVWHCALTWGHDGMCQPPPRQEQEKDGEAECRHPLNLCAECLEQILLPAEARLAEVEVERDLYKHYELSRQSLTLQALEAENQQLRERVAVLDEGPVCLLADYKEMRDRLTRELEEARKELGTALLVKGALERENASLAQRIAELQGERVGPSWLCPDRLATGRCSHAHDERAEAAEQREAALRGALEKIATNTIGSRYGQVQIARAALSPAQDAAPEKDRT